MNDNPPPINTGWGDAKNGPSPPWALWFENLTRNISGNLVVASASGSITSYTATYDFRQIGNLICLLFDITITNAGTGSGDLNITLPHVSASIITGQARETVSGYMCSCAGLAGTTFGIRKYDNTTIIATNNRLIGSVIYFI